MIQEVHGVDVEDVDDLEWRRSFPVRLLIKASSLRCRIADCIGAATHLKPARGGRAMRCWKRMRVHENTRSSDGGGGIAQGPTE